MCLRVQWKFREIIFQSIKKKPRCILGKNQSTDKIVVKKKTDGRIFKVSIRTWNAVAHPFTSSLSLPILHLQLWGVGGAYPSCLRDCKYCFPTRCTFINRWHKWPQLVSLKNYSINDGTAEWRRPSASSLTLKCGSHLHYLAAQPKPHPSL